MGSLSRRKGKRGELEAAALLRSHGFEARRGQQFKGGAGSPDVVHSMDGFHIEVKRVENLALYPALEQANRDAGSGETPLVLHRRNSKPWVAIMDADAFLALVTLLRNFRADIEGFAVDASSDKTDAGLGNTLPPA